MRKQSSVAQIAIFFAIMLVLHLLSSVIFNLLPVPIKPTISTFRSLSPASSTDRASELY